MDFQIWPNGFSNLAANYFSNFSKSAAVPGWACLGNCLLESTSSWRRSSAIAGGFGANKINFVDNFLRKPLNSSLGTVGTIICQNGEETSVVWLNCRTNDSPYIFSGAVGVGRVHKVRQGLAVSPVRGDDQIQDRGPLGRLPQAHDLVGDLGLDLE